MPRDGSDLIRIVGTKEGVDSARHEIQIISDEQVTFGVPKQPLVSLQYCLLRGFLFFFSNPRAS